MPSVDLQVPRFLHRKLWFWGFRPFALFLVKLGVSSREGLLDLRKVGVLPIRFINLVFDSFFVRLLLDKSMYEKASSQLGCL